MTTAKILLALVLIPAAFGQSNQNQPRAFVVGGMPTNVHEGEDLTPPFGDGLPRSAVKKMNSVEASAIADQAIQKAYSGMVAEIRDFAVAVDPAKGGLYREMVSTTNDFALATSRVRGKFLVATSQKESPGKSFEDAFQKVLNALESVPYGPKRDQVEKVVINFHNYVESIVTPTVSVVAAK